jgi:formylglycine-generating enzyme required for sulfatase activity
MDTGFFAVIRAPLMSSVQLRSKWLLPFTTIAALVPVGSNPACAEGTVVCWGSNDQSQCNVPPGMSEVVQLVGGGDHTVALRADGTISAWGDNSFGQLDAPEGLQGALVLACGYGHTVACDGFGKVSCWGRNDFGQCDVPTGLLGVVQVAAGGVHTLALRVDGTVTSWGNNDYGQRDVPGGLTSAVQVAGGLYHSLAVNASGSVSAWGYNYFAQCEVPPSLNGAVEVSAGFYHSIALLDDGSVVCWGRNDDGQCNVPSGLGEVSQVVAGGYHTLVRRADGKISGWGFNLNGECSSPSGLEGVVRLAAGKNHSVALVCDGVSETRSSGELAPFVPLATEAFTVSDIDPSSNGATLHITGRGNLGTSTKFFTVRIDGQVLATNVFGSGSGAGNCTADASVVSLQIPSAQFAALTADRQLVVQITPSSLATSAGCSNATLVARLDWQRDLIDCDGNQIDDECDIAVNPEGRDCDDDGVLDSCQIAAGAADVNGNGRLDSCEPDCNGSGLPDSWEVTTGLVPDCNSNGQPDSCDVAAGGGSSDVDQNGIPDECKADCNDNSLPDAFEIATGQAVDCNGNGVPDPCDITANPTIDCDANGIPDSCDIAGNPGRDCDRNGEIDSCEIAGDPLVDCDGNNVPDACDLVTNPSRDCNANGSIDACDVMAGAEDENANGTPDACELAAGDLDLDGVVGGGDLAAFLSVWSVPGAPYGDFDADGTVDGADLALLLTSWGDAPWGQLPTPPWATALARYPSATIVTSAELRRRIAGTNLPWRVVDTATQIEMVLIPPGTFDMGCSPSNQFGCIADENPVHPVTLTSAFYMGRYEVTQAQWQSRMGTNPSYFQTSSSQVPAAQVPNRPVEQVSWNMIAGAGGFMAQTGMRLPTEAEWEYAYRAGTTAAFHGSVSYPDGTDNDSVVGQIAWFDQNASSQTRPVGGKAANGFGLHDMSGGVWEWVGDWYGAFAAGPQTDPIGSSDGSNRVLRGGAWDSNVTYVLRSSARGANVPGFNNRNLGFRIARSPYVSPAIESVVPAGGPISGGTAITISGANLTGTTAVTIGGAAATNVLVVDSSKVKAIAPPGSAGSADVVVSGSKGAVTVVGGFTYAEVPNWATVIEALPDPLVVTDPELRAAIAATGLPWRVRDTATQLELLLVPPSVFQMGCVMGSDQHGCNTVELPVHEVSLTNAYYLGRYEVTQLQWTSTMGSNPSYFQGHSDSASRPVEAVTWDAIQGYLGATGFRLPTEAEWENACRARTQTPFYNGSTADSSLSGLASFGSCCGGNSGGETHAVGGKLANALGFHDMLGNVWEWVNDRYGSFSADPQTNPGGPVLGDHRVIRGGDWYNPSSNVRSSFRGPFLPASSYYVIGFRVARNP